MNEEWMTRFPPHRMMKGEPCHSDHRPVIMVTNPPSRKEWSRGNAPIFYFEAEWVVEDQCATIMENVLKLSMEVLGESTGRSPQRCT